MKPEIETPRENLNDSPEAQGVAIDGFQQVLEMLKIADPEFRESILRRLALRDKELARSLRADLSDF